jgi:uncharacterized membrane protein
MRPHPSSPECSSLERRSACLLAGLLASVLLALLWPLAVHAQSFDVLVRATGAARNGAVHTYTVCVKPRQLNDQACVWSLDVEEDAPGVLATRPWAVQVSEDGLRLAVLLRKRSETASWDELWRYEQSLNPKFAAPGMSRDERLQTRKRKIANGSELQFGGNDGLTRFVLSEGQSLHFINGEGRETAPVVSIEAVNQMAGGEVPAAGDRLQLVARQDARVGFVQWRGEGTQLARRLLVADLDALAADAYDLRNIAMGDQQLAWNLSRNWVAMGDASAPTDPRKSHDLRLRVIDLASARTLWSTSNATPFDPNWRNADLLEYALPNKRLTTHRFESVSERLLQGQLRLQGNRLIFLPCRERTMLQVETEGSDSATIDTMRELLGSREKLAVEFLGFVEGASVRLSRLVQAGTTIDACRASVEHAHLEAQGRDPGWKFTLGRGTARLELEGQAAQTWNVGTTRFIEGSRQVDLVADAVRTTVRAAPEVCRAPGSDTLTGYRVQVQSSGKSYSGCGSVIDASR